MRNEESDRTMPETTEDKLEAARVDQNAILAAFVAKHKIEPDDVAVEFLKLAGGRVLWHVRKMSAKERSARDALAIRRDVAAIAQSKAQTFVFVPAMRAGKSALLARLLAKLKPTKVYLTERGAAQAGDGSVSKVEVLA